MDALYELKALWNGLQKVLDSDDLQANLDLVKGVSVMCDLQSLQSLNHVIKMSVAVPYHQNRRRLF